MSGSSLRTRLQERREALEASMRRDAARRGFPTINDRAFAVRAFLLCWAEPGFHRFWRVWNPGISYFVHRLYLRLGGRAHRDRNTVLAFMANGLVHNLVVLPFFQRWWSWTIPVAFLAFGLFTVASRRLEDKLRQERWPWPLNVAVNVGLVCLCMNLGFRVEAWVY